MVTFVFTHACSMILFTSVRILLFRFLGPGIRVPLSWPRIPDSIPRFGASGSGPDSGFPHGTTQGGRAPRTSGPSPTPGSAPWGLLAPFGLAVPEPCACPEAEPGRRVAHTSCP